MDFRNPALEILLECVFKFQFRLRLRVDVRLDVGSASTNPLGFACFALLDTITDAQSRAWKRF